MAGILIGPGGGIAFSNTEGIRRTDAGCGKPCCDDDPTNECCGYRGVDYALDCGGSVISPPENDNRQFGLRQSIAFTYSSEFASSNEGATAFGPISSSPVFGGGVTVDQACRGCPGEFVRGWEIANAAYTKISGSTTITDTDACPRQVPIDETTLDATFSGRDTPFVTISSRPPDFDPCDTVPDTFELVESPTSQTAQVTADVGGPYQVPTPSAGLTLIRADGTTAWPIPKGGGVNLCSETYQGADDLGGIGYNNVFRRWFEGIADSGNPATYPPTDACAGNSGNRATFEWSQANTLWWQIDVDYTELGTVINVMAVLVQGRRREVWADCSCNQLGSPPPNNILLHALTDGDTYVFRDSAVLTHTVLEACPDDPPAGLMQMMQGGGS